MTSTGISAGLQAQDNDLAAKGDEISLKGLSLKITTSMNQSSNVYLKKVIRLALIATPYKLGYGTAVPNVPLGITSATDNTYLFENITNTTVQDVFISKFDRRYCRVLWHHYLTIPQASFSGNYNFAFMKKYINFKGRRFVFWSDDPNFVALGTGCRYSLKMNYYLLGCCNDEVSSLTAPTTNAGPTLLIASTLYFKDA